MCSGRQMGVSSYDQRGSSFFKLDRFLPNLVQLSPRNPSRIFSKICHGPVFANPLPRLKLGSSDANSSNVINHTADFWVALRRSRRFPILIISYFKDRTIHFFLLYLRRNCHNFVVDNPFLPFWQVHVYNWKADEKEKSRLLLLSRYCCIDETFIARI